MSNKYIQQARDEREDIETEDMTIGQFLSFAEDNPFSVSDAVNYLLAAIEHFGTRTVLENGEEKERYRFFDDPYGDGEHAILGNTDTLNEFVDELRRRSSNRGENDKIIWILGPTATGKSELKRCIINGLKGFAKTEEGARYTIKLTLDDKSASGLGMTYGGGNNPNSEDHEYYKSPVNVNPLTVLPERTREAFLEDIDSGSYEIEDSLDPFCQETMEELEEREESFEDILDSDSVKATRYVPEVGDGIGVLHSEDQGNPKQKLVGQWMKGASQKYAKRGQKNPHAFSYDGVLAQGNRMVSIVEDAGHHSDVLDKMLNVCEEQMVKLDNRISMDLDTLIFVFSNPDLESQLKEYSDSLDQDPLKALRRRLDKYTFGYLTTLSIEGMLIKRLLSDESYLWDNADDRMERVSDPMELYGTEIAPRVVEAAAMYEIVSRIEDVANHETAIQQALLLEHGEYVDEKGTVYDGEDAEIEAGEIFGIPVTYTVDQIVDLAQEEDVVLPDDILQRMSMGLEDAPVFSETEANKFEDMMFTVQEYVFSKQEEDVLEAMVGDINVTEEDVRDYIDSILAWNDGEEDDYDPYELKEFETRYLGVSKEGYSTGASPMKAVKNFRDDIISPINKYMWDKKDEDFKVHDVPISESPSLKPLLEENDWDTIGRMFPDADLSQWQVPPENTQTEKLKEKTVDRMIELFGYSEESAEAVSKKVVESKELQSGSLFNDGD